MYVLCKVDELKSGSENVRKLIEAASNVQLESMTDDAVATSTESLSSSSNSDVQYGTFGEAGSLTLVIEMLKSRLSRPEWSPV